jgi:hypothetical protein
VLYQALLNTHTLVETKQMAEVYYWYGIISAVTSVISFTTTAIHETIVVFFSVFHLWQKKYAIYIKCFIAKY